MFEGVGEIVTDRQKESEHVLRHCAVSVCGYGGDWYRFFVAPDEIDVIKSRRPSGDEL